MSRFIKSPNLPENKVNMLICGGLNEQLLVFLKDRGTEILFTAENKYVDKSISRHVDISALYLGDGKIIVDKEQKKLIDALNLKGFNVIESTGSVGGAYPDDVILNHAVIGNLIIGKHSIFDESVNKNISSFKILDVKQGYSKCSTLVVDGNSIITDDKSIALKASENGLECLLIDKGDILLDGQEYGFIGGASGKISKDEILFFGDITKHRSFNRIKAFLNERNLKFVYFDFPLTDYGGLIPVSEL